MRVHNKMALHRRPVNPLPPVKPEQFLIRGNIHHVGGPLRLLLLSQVVGRGTCFPVKNRQAWGSEALYLL